MSHGNHHHSHSHTHSFCATNNSQSSKRMLIAFLLNFSFAIIELVGGIYTQSVAIQSDALHDFGDSFAILLSMFFDRYSQKPSNKNYSYGYRRYSLIGAIVTGTVLVFGSLYIFKECIHRFFNPVSPEVNGMLWLAILGIVVNVFAVLKMSKAVSLNEKMILLHLWEDVFGWCIVLIGAVFIKIFDWTFIDPILGIGLSVWVLFNAVRNLRATLKVFLLANPSEISVEEIEKSILKFPLVKGVHHSHLWSLDGNFHIYTAHIVVPSGIAWDEIDRVKIEIKRSLHHLNIVEATLEFEIENGKCFDPEHNVDSNKENV